MRSSHRRFTLFDMILLVGALAVGLSASAVLYTEMSSPHLIFRPAKPLTRIGPGYYALFISDTTDLATPCLAALTLTLAGLALRRPRPTFREVWSPPGVAGCLVATFAWSVPLIYQTSKDRLLGYEANLIIMMDSLRADAGMVVTTTWLIMALQGRWRPVTGWLDAAGRMLCILWVAIPFINECIEFSGRD